MGDRKTVKIVNEYTSDAGTLVAYKKFSIDGNEITGENDLMNLPAPTFTLTSTDGSTFTRTLQSYFGWDQALNKNVWRVEFKNIPIGTYNISETAYSDTIVQNNQNTNHQDVTYNYLSTTSEDASNISITKNAVVSTPVFTNTYTSAAPTTASLTVNKSINISGQDDTEFSFTIKQISDGTNINQYVKVDGNTVSYVDGTTELATVFTVSKNTPITISGLEKAKYLVEETTKDIDGYTLNSTTLANGASVTSVNADLTDGNKSVTFENNYTEILTDVIISKKTSGNAELKGAELTLTSNDGNTISWQQRVA